MDIPGTNHPVFPERALSSKAVLYRPMQDIDIYVEDEGSEAFYIELLKRLIGTKVRISTIVPLRGRLNVLKKAKEYSEARPAVFLLDGDLEWVAGVSLPTVPPHLYIHPCYCIENYLFCERAMIQIVVENSGSISESDAKTKLNWKKLRNQLEEHIVPLFIEFAVAFVLCPEIKTVSRGIDCLLQNSKKGSSPQLDIEKIIMVRKEVKAEVLKHVDTTTYIQKLTFIENQVKVLSDPLDAVSGKNFLLPIQMFEANKVGGQKVRRKSFVFRLAKHCSLHKLEDLRNKIFQMIELNKDIEAPA